MIHVELPLLSLDGGTLLIPAEDVTALLREIAGEYRSWSDPSSTDPQDVTEAALVLDQLADRIDVECIAATENPPDEK